MVWEHQADMLRGTLVDFKENAKESGFSVKNPNFEGEALKKWLPILQAQEKK